MRLRVFHKLCDVFPNNLYAVQRISETVSPRVPSSVRAETIPPPALRLPGLPELIQKSTRTVRLIGTSHASSTITSRKTLAPHYHEESSRLKASVRELRI